MDLLACSECERRYYLPGFRPDHPRLCPRCGATLTVTRRGMSSIPLDARALDPSGGCGAVGEISVVALRRKHDGDGQQILEGLADYFAVKARDGAVAISVNRGGSSDAALRVAAVLDGIDANWEEHFYLPTDDSKPEDRDPGPPTDNVVPLLGHRHRELADGPG